MSSRYVVTKKNVATNHSIKSVQSEASIKALIKLVDPNGEKGLLYKLKLGQSIAFQRTDTVNAKGDTKKVNYQISLKK